MCKADFEVKDKSKERGKKVYRSQTGTEWDYITTYNMPESFIICCALYLQVQDGQSFLKRNIVILKFLNSTVESNFLCRKTVILNGFNFI